MGERLISKSTNRDEFYFEFKIQGIHNARQAAWVHTVLHTAQFDGAYLSSTSTIYIWICICIIYTAEFEPHAIIFF